MELEGLAQCSARLKKSKIHASFLVFLFIYFRLVLFCPEYPKTATDNFSSYRSNIIRIMEIKAAKTGDKVSSQFLEQQVLKCHLRSAAIAFVPF